MNEKISLQDLVELLSTKHGMTKKNADALVRGMFDLIEEALSNEKYVKIKGLGTFKLTEVDSRESMNVNTGERIEIQGHTKISFTPDTTMKELINKPFSHFETVVLNEGVLLEDTPVVDEEIKSEDVADEMAENVVAQPVASVEQPAEVEPEKKVEEDVPVEEKPVEIPEIQEAAIEEPISEEPTTTEVKEEIPAPVIESTIEETESQEVVVEEETPTEEKETVVSVQEQATEEEKVVEERIEKEQEVEMPAAVSQQGKSTYKVLIGIIIVLLLVILFGFYWMFFRAESTSETQVPQKPIQEETVVNQTDEQPVVKEDTLQTVKDTVAVQPETSVQTTVLSEDVVYDITGTIATLTLEPGQTLVKLALKYYGSKNFWPYIMQHNPEVIKDADIVPVGATIKIPKLEPKK